MGSRSALAPTPAPAQLQATAAAAASLNDLESAVVSSASPFGQALQPLLATAGPIRDTDFHLSAWLHVLDIECSSTEGLTVVTPPAATALTVLTAAYTAEFATVCGTSITAEDAVSAFSNGTLARLVTSNGAPRSAAEERRLTTVFLTIDGFIREHPPDWTAPPDTVDPDQAFALVCAELYVTLRSGFDILPLGTVVETPTETPNYRSVVDGISDCREEVGRLRKLGHLISWTTAQRRHSSLRGRARPDHVLALGAVIKKKPSGKTKTRLVVDPSRGISRKPPHDEVPGLNDSIDLPSCKLPTVQQAARALRLRSWFFKGDAVDAFMQTKHSVDSLRHMGVLFDGELLVYDSLCFGLKSAPAHQQRLATVFTRIVMRRWAQTGINIGAIPGHDLHQAWPDVGDMKAYFFAYLDDFFGLGFDTKAEADTAYQIFVDTAAELGLQLQYEDDKTVPPTQKTDFLGVIFCSRTLSLSLSPDRISKMLDDLLEIQASDTISVLHLQKTIGVLMFACVVFSLCRPFLRQMLNVLKAAGPSPPKRRLLAITAAARDDFEMWKRILTVLKLNSRPVSGLPTHARTIKAELYTDASFEGGGYFFGGLWRMWRWPADMRARIGDFAGLSDDDGIFICELEALALLQAIRDIIGICAGGNVMRRLVCHIDNEPVVSMLTKHSSRSSACTPILRELTGMLLAHSLELFPVWIATADNDCADLLSAGTSLRHGATAEELVATLRRWTAAHPDVTGWSPRPPVRPELLHCFGRHPFGAPGSMERGIRCAPSRKNDAVCFTCGADPCECVAVKGVNRTWTRLPAR